MSIKGTNWGKLSTEGDSLSLNNITNGMPIFKIDYDNINNSVINKNDIIIETTAEQVGIDDSICQIRFHIQQPKQQIEIENQNDNEEKLSFAQQMYKKIVQKAKIGQFAGESIVTLNEVNLAVPRGKYTIDFYQKNMRFHGITFNYNVEYKNIVKGFILPMINESQVSIVLQLNKDKPIYHGQTIYHYLVIQIKKQLEVDIKTKINPQLIQKENNNLKQLKLEYSGFMFQVLIDLIQTLVNINLIHPGNSFKSKTNQCCIKCNVKAQPGWLYLLKQSLIFINKPIIYFKINDIKLIQFIRLGAINKQFDMKITFKDQKKPIEFMAIERIEVQSLMQYFKQKNIRVNMQQQPTKIIRQIAMQDDSQQDQDFNAQQDQVDQQDDDDSSSKSSNSNQQGSRNKNQNKSKKQ